MEDLQAIKERQKQWMRQRQIDLEKQNFPELSPGDLVNALTDKLTKNLPKIQKNIEKAVASEVETNTCSICFELMLPKVHSPMLLFPCGHTFCRQCMETNLKTGKKICPWCREKIVSQAVNLSLQNIIVAYAKENNVKLPTEEKPQQSYDNQIEMYELRYNILHQEKENNIQEIEILQKRIQEEELGQRILQTEEEKILKRIQDCEKELDLVRTHLKKSENHVELLSKDLETRYKSIQLIDETLVPVDREMKKLITLKRINKN
jgi:hypothetical protein